MYKSAIDFYNMSLTTKYSNGSYFDSGVMVGRVEKVLIGLPPECAAPALPDTYDQTAAPLFMSGYLYGISGHHIDEQEYIQVCWKQNDDATAYLYSAMSDFAAGNYDAVQATLTCATGSFDEAMEECLRTNGYFWTAEQFYSNFEQQSDYTQQRDANYQKNQLTVDRDVGYLPYAWSTGQFLNAGFWMGEIRSLTEGQPDFSASTQ